MNKFQRFIATILIIGLVLSLNFNLFIFKPKEVKAIPVAETAVNVKANLLKTIKDLLLDTIGHTITQRILQAFQQKITDWGHGRKSSEMRPFQVIDWRMFFAEAINRGAARFIEEFDGAFDFLSEPCEQGLKLKESLEGFGFGLYSSDLPPYSQYARPNLASLLPEECTEFFNSGYSLIKGGWNGWLGLTMYPQNNIFGQVLMAERARITYEGAEKEAADKETAVSDGVENEKATTQTNVEACKERCAAVGPPSPDCLQKCEEKPAIAMKTRVKNWGSDIHTMMENALGSDMARLIGVDEITELLGVIFSALTNKAINMGLAFAAGFKAQNDSERRRTEIRTQFSYQKAFKKELTIEDIKDVRSQTLSNILKTVQQLSGSVSTCDEEELMDRDDFVKNITDVFSPSVEALYIGLEGVNLKPDYIVLDPPFAPYTVYGYSWGHVPDIKFPDKCKKITDQLNLGDKATCRSIKSGLEPNYSAQCETCMYDHDALNCPPKPLPPQPYPAPANAKYGGRPNPYPGPKDPWPEKILKDKSDFYSACKTPYDKTLKICDECLKKADDKCGELDGGDKKNQCILIQCSNYADVDLKVVSPPVDGLDFYNKCLIEENKDACYTCLKEYFMPATYCNQTLDYMGRSLIKYPALIKGGSWEIESTLLDIVLSANVWIGPYDKKIWELRGGVCDDNDLIEPIDLAVICRILPEFKYLGQKYCETMCSRAGLTGQALKDALKDIADFRPHSKDCGNLRLPIGGTETWGPVMYGVFKMRGECCAALWQQDKNRYAFCIGTGEPTAALCTYAKPVEQEPWCYCDEGWRPLSFTRTGLPRVGGKGGDCHDDSFTLNTLTEVMGYTNNDPAGSMVYIASGGCTETDETCHNTTGVGLQDAPCTPSGVTDATGPSGVAFSQNTPGSKDNAPRNRKEWVIGNLWGNYHTGVYNNDNSDGATGWHVCAKCDEDDPGYPFYGFQPQIDQCNWKAE